MPAGIPRAYLVCYDIADPRRLRRVHRELKSCALPVQYSVFLALMSPRQVKQLMKRLEELIDTRRDDIRAYPIPDHPEVDWLGTQFWPQEAGFLHAKLGPLLSTSSDGETAN